MLINSLRKVEKSDNMAFLILTGLIVFLALLPIIMSNKSDPVHNNRRIR